MTIVTGTMTRIDGPVQEKIIKNTCPHSIMEVQWISTPCCPGSNPGEGTIIYARVA